MKLNSILKFFLIIIAYLLSSKLGTIFNIPPGYVTSLSPSAGVSFACLLLFGVQYWFSIFLGASLFLFLDSSTLFQNFSLINLICAKLILALSIVLQAVAATLFVRNNFKNRLFLVSSKEIIEFIVFSGPVSCLISSVTVTGLLFFYNQLEISEILTQFFIGWLGQCFGVIIFSPVILASLAKPRNIWQRRKNLIVGPVCAAVLALIIAFNFFKKLENSRIKGTFEKQIETIHQLLERQLNYYVDVLYSFESFYSSSVEVDRQEFKLFSNNFLRKFPGIKFVEWIPRITQEQKSIFEEKIKQEQFLSNFYIYEYNQNRDKKIVSEKDEYFPVQYVESLQNNIGDMGYDVSSQPDYLDALSKAKDLGLPVAAVLMNNQKNFMDQNLMVFLPIYKNNLPHNLLDQRRKNLQGFIMCEFFVKEIIQSVASKFENRNFVLEAYDITRLQPTQLAHTEASNSNSHSPDSKSSFEYRSLKLTKFLNIAGRNWEVTYAPTVNYFRVEQSWNLWFILIGAVGFTSFFCIYLLIISGRTMKIEELIKEKTDELKKREERFDLAIQGSSDGLWDWYNLEADDQWWSPRFYELIGYQPEEVKPSQSLFMELVHPEDRKILITARQNHFENGKPFQVEFRLLNKAGQYRWCRVEGKAYKNENGQFIRMAGSLADITDSKRIEMELKEEKQKALDLVAKAQMAVKLKQEFLANVSHEIRSPMNSILGFTDLLNKTSLDEKQKNYLDAIQSSGKSLLDVINDLLDFSRIERGQIQLESIEFNLEYLVNNVVRDIAAKLEELPITTYVDIDLSVPKKLVGDATRIRQILLHLLSNAVKFTRQGEIGVLVSLAQELQGDNVVLQFCIKDTGVGITREKQLTIFDSFSYAESSTQRQTEGLGLGLAICRRMIEIMGGQISVASEKGKGSEFTFTLKLKKSFLFNLSATWLLKEELKNKKVFILDNNRKSQEITYQYCRELGLDVVGSADFGKGALNKIDGLCQAGIIPDVIICEMMMSGMEPEDFVKKIKSQPLCHSVKMVSITSNAQPGAAKFVRELGFDAYLSKPINRNDIEGILRVLLSQQTSEGLFVTRHLVKEMSCQGVRILVGEDDMADQNLIKAFFKNLECEGDFVVNGNEIIEMLKKNTYDLCLMDIKMPVLDGLTATQIIRKDINKTIPIIALTNYATSEDQEKCIQGGMNYFLTKPVNIAQLREAIIRFGRKRMG